jgi:hypothetical protein
MLEEEKCYLGEALYEEEEKCYLGEALYLEEVGLVDEARADMIKQNGQS